MNKGGYMRYILLLLLLTACGKSEFPTDEPSIYGRWIIQSKTCDDGLGMEPMPLYKNTLTISADTATSVDEIIDRSTWTVQKQTITYSHQNLVFTATDIECSSPYMECPSLELLILDAKIDFISSTAMILTTRHAYSRVCESKLVR